MIGVFEVIGVLFLVMLSVSKAQVYLGKFPINLDVIFFVIVLF